MNNKRCCFAGHSKIYDSDEIYTRLLKLIENMIIEEYVSEFWVGNYGSFDGMCARAVRVLKEKYNDIQLNLVIPYLTSEINQNKELYYNNYNSIIMADIPEKTPKKLYILKCNEYMIKQSDFIICYVQYNWGGAARTMEYAEKQKHIKVFNLA